MFAEILVSVCGVVVAVTVRSIVSGRRVATTRKQTTVRGFVSVVSGIVIIREHTCVIASKYEEKIQICIGVICSFRAGFNYVFGC